jgi:prolyl oligopeptidase
VRLTRPRNGDAAPGLTRGGLTQFRQNGRGPIGFPSYVEEDEEEEGQDAPLEGESRQASQHGPGLTSPNVTYNFPPARRDDVVDVLHGTTVPDPYRWLEDGDSPETKAWVAEQNSRTREALDTVASRARWHERLSALVTVPQTHVLARRGDRLFVFHREGDQPQPALEVGSTTDPSTQRRVLFDPSTLAEDGAATIDWCSPSRSGDVLAIGISEGGTENSTLHLLDVATGTVRTDATDIIPNTRAATVAWFPDDSGFWYTRYPEGDEYNRKVYRHVIGTAWEDDPLVWGDLPTPDAWTSVEARRDGRYLIVSASVGWSRNDQHLYDVEADTWTTIIEGVEANTAFGFDGDRLVGTTDLDAPRGRVITAPIATPTQPHWQDLVAEGETVIEGWWRSGSALFVTGLRHAMRVITRHASNGGLLQELQLPALAECVGVANDRDRDDIFLSLTSYTFPTCSWHWSPDRGLMRWGSEPALAFDPDTLTVRRLSYPSLDGTPIGLTVVHRTDSPPSADSRAWLTGYGGFNIALTPAYSSAIVAWCETGGVFAVAGLRGGNEEGEAWHQAGMRENKQNVFDDFHSAADFMVAEGLTSREQLVVRGGSNGGLLMGAALTQRPDLVRAIVCEVPLLDMVRFPQFLIAKLWTHEYGDPDVADEFEWILSYSPYHHVHDGSAYPATFFVTAEGDTRVDPCHARKMAAAIQWATGGDAPILFKQGERAGHGAGKPVAKVVDDTADVFAFIDLALA